MTESQDRPDTEDRPGTEDGTEEEPQDLEVQEVDERGGETESAPDTRGSEPGFRVVEPAEEEELLVVESPDERRERAKREKKENEESDQPKPRINFWVILLMFGVLFVMIDEGLRTGTANLVGFVMEPIVGFDGRYPTLTVILTGLIMIFLTTVLRHFFIDWLRIAKVQNTMKAFQKEFNQARREKDTKRINELQKVQPKVMGLQAEMTGSQMKPMAFSMLIVVPLFAWLWEFIREFEFHFFSTPWNLHVDMFTTEGIIFGTSILPHWILLYSVMSIPFGQILQKALKMWSWRDRMHNVFGGEPEIEEAGP